MKRLCKKCGKCVHKILHLEREKVKKGFEKSANTAGPNHPPKGLIMAKFAYLLHFFLFLDQTCQIDYDCWSNDIKFLFDAKCQIVTSLRLTSPKFQSQTYIIWKSLKRGVKQRNPFLATTRKTRVIGLQKNLIAPPGTILFLKKRSLWYFFHRRGVKQRKPFLATTCKTRVIGLQRNLIAPPGTIRFLKKRFLWYFFHSFLQNKLIFRWHKPFIVGQNRIILDFCFLTQKH